METKLVIYKEQYSKRVKKQVQEREIRESDRRERKSVRAGDAVRP